MSESEQWLPVVGFPAYEVSDRGSVRSVTRTVWHGRSGWITLHGKPRKLCYASDRKHLALSLQRNGKAYTRYVHQLVAEAFIGPCPEGLEVCHGPNGPADNTVQNLRYDTQSANRLDTVRDGTNYHRNLLSCPGGHRLVEPNLRPSKARDGFRCCRACNRATAIVSEAARRGVQLNKAAEADAAYERIMSRGPRRKNERLSSLTKTEWVAKCIDEGVRVAVAAAQLGVTAKYMDELVRAERRRRGDWSDGRRSRRRAADGCLYLHGDDGERRRVA